MASMTTSGVLDRHPKLRCAFSRGDGRRPRQWRACWLALTLVAVAAARSVLVQATGVEPHADALGSGAVHTGRLPAAGAGQRMALHRKWFQRNALADLLDEDVGLAEIHKLYCRPLLVRQQ
jgi:hypothetical protein